MSNARHGRARMLPTIPCPYARPKCRNDAGETTSTSTPRARTCSTASATKRPAGSSGERGYEVVRTGTFTRETYALADAAGEWRRATCRRRGSARPRSGARRDAGRLPARRVGVVRSASPRGRPRSPSSSQRARARCAGPGRGLAASGALLLWTLAVGDLVGATGAVACSRRGARCSTSAVVLALPARADATRRGYSCRRRTSRSPGSSSTHSRGTCSARGTSTRSSCTTCSQPLGYANAVGNPRRSRAPARTRPRGRGDPLRRLGASPPQRRCRCSRGALALTRSTRRTWRSARGSRRLALLTPATLRRLLAARAVARAGRRDRGGRRPSVEPVRRPIATPRIPGGRCSIVVLLACAAVAAAAVARVRLPSAAADATGARAASSSRAVRRRRTRRRRRGRTLRLDRAAGVVLPRRLA